jgi:peptidoglycan hydrolase CwlO-like protein
VWLSLIGIDDAPAIIKNSKVNRQRLTWRTFVHLLLIKETVVFEESSILLPKQYAAHTSALSALLYLITGQDFVEFDPVEEKKLREARKKAVTDFINKKLSDFSERMKQLQELQLGDEGSLQEKVESVLGEISETEEKITYSVNQNKQLLNRMYSLNEQLAECNSLYHRYQSLKTQYISDIKRLTFVVEGEFHKGSNQPKTTCPVCESNVTISNTKHKVPFVEASHAELHRIQMQLSDLIEAEQDLIKEQSELESNLNRLQEEKSEVELLINTELNPRIAALQSTLGEYRRAIEIRNEAELISQYETTMKSDLHETMNEAELATEFKIKGQFSRDMILEWENYLSKILKACKFDFSSAYFDQSSFDVVINGDTKSTFGKGYRAFLNTVLALSIMKYLSDKGKYAPGILIIDSPILSLKEREDGIATDTMKEALFQYLLNNMNDGQVIIIENDIPDLDYSSANVIRFTKDQSTGRYGFLEDYQR